ncbi:YerC/YecD family TrpR-related protein [Calidifontibacillus erzurumensis]|uniref:YerC/YecD family TrpR-related protein n=1 Tax=Calidifontibacillus erzurumensis TaxID=2741433 RepID=UPI001E65419D|nr:YerC/YecD family TrpR-related protein [Calidifontibacillus erzurumensis]
MQIDKLRGRALDQLFEAILSLKDIEECYRFFDDLCTVNEIQSLAQRLEVARMLQEGYTYHRIETETGASTATISRVKRCLNYGNDAYAMALNRIRKNKKDREENVGNSENTPSNEKKMNAENDI